MTSPVPITIGMRVQMRKKHPCGGDIWRVVRIGADIGIVCEQCQRRVLLDREEFERRIKEILDAPIPPSLAKETP